LRSEGDDEKKAGVRNSAPLFSRGFDARRKLIKLMKLPIRHTTKETSAPNNKKSIYARARDSRLTLLSEASRSRNGDPDLFQRP